MADGLPSKRTVDRVGGAGSILAGLACAVLGWMDFRGGHNTWKAWPIVAIVLLLNGIAMLAVARRATKKVAAER